jgi:hypothetical protein
MEPRNIAVTIQALEAQEKTFFGFEGPIEPTKIRLVS